MKQWFRLTVVPGGNTPTWFGLLVQLLGLAAIVIGLLFLIMIEEQTIGLRHQWIVTPIVRKIFDPPRSSAWETPGWEIPTNATREAQQ